jgi:hypothetical protein
MKIVLTTPFNPGDLDPGKSYPHVYIPRLSDAPTGTTLSFDYEYGTAVNQTVSVPGIGALGTAGNATVYNWTKGMGSFTKTLNVSGNTYLKIVNSTPVVSTDTCYNMILRQLYQFLLDGAYVAGSISNP